jgi:hypothetical protein
LQCSNGSFGISLFLNDEIFQNIIIFAISSSLFQYSDRIIGSTEINDASEKRYFTQLFGAGKSKGVRGIIRMVPRGT